MENLSSEHFREALEIVKGSGVSVSYKSIADRLNIHPQCLSDIIKYKRQVTTKILEQSVIELDFNPVFLLTGQGPYFNSQIADEPATEPSLVDFNEITYIPIAAQAGYVEQVHNDLYLEELPTFKLPGNRMLGGDLRCFDVAGDSMFPTFNDGDKIICRKVDQECWATNIRSNYVYVLITDNSIVVKRIENNLNKSSSLKLISDNDQFTPVDIEGNEIREVWTVLMTINYFKPHAHLESKVVLSEMDQLRAKIAEQEEMLLQRTVELTELKKSI